MSKISFIGYWAKQWQAQFKIPKGYLLIKPKAIYNKNLGEFLNRLHDFQSKKKQLREINCKFEYHYRKRTLDQNNLLWALYEIEANEMNGGLQGRKDQMVTSMELYENDLKDFAPRIEMKIPADQYNYYKTNYRIEFEMPLNDDKGITKFYKVIVIESTSHFNTLQMAKWIDRIFNRISINGVACTNPGEIQDYWIKWRQNLNNEKIIIHDDLLTPDQYRNLNPICEATGEPIHNGTGHICHIKARGMGGKHEAEKDYSSNLLHLSIEAHIATQHQKGWKYFLKLYPHLRYKVETALRRNYKIIDEGKELYEKSESNLDKIKTIFDGKEV